MPLTAYMNLYLSWAIAEIGYRGHTFGIWAIAFIKTCADQGTCYRFSPKSNFIKRDEDIFPIIFYHSDRGSIITTSILSVRKYYP